MNILVLLLQAFFDQQARNQTDRLREAGVRAAEKGRRVATAGVFILLAVAFFFSALLIGLIDLGLQIDRGNGIAYSGLMVSTTILIILALVAIFAGWLVSREPAVVEAPPRRPAPTDDLRQALEEIAVMFLREFKDRHEQSSQQKRDQAGSEK